MQFDYHLLDVFTRTRFSGNQLAIVMKTDNMDRDQMQTIAREFNLSETVFVRQPLSDKHTASLKIFTPKAELPFAGHPTIGAAVLLGLQQRSSAVRLEEEVGLITCIMESIDRHSGRARFGLPRLPEEVGPAPSAEQIGPTLGIAPEDVGCGDMVPAYFSAGVDFYLVPVRNAEVLRSIKLERRGWAQVYPGGHHSVYAYTATPDERLVDFAARMFSPGMGIDEDPATGAAAAALIGYLARHVTQEGQVSYRLRQGDEIGRPSIIELQLQAQNGQVVRGGIGGEAILVASGKLDLS